MNSNVQTKRYLADEDDWINDQISKELDQLGDNIDLIDDEDDQSSQPINAWTTEQAENGHDDADQCIGKLQNNLNRRTTTFSNEIHECESILKETTSRIAGDDDRLFIKTFQDKYGTTELDDILSLRKDVISRLEIDDQSDKDEADDDDENDNSKDTTKNSHDTNGHDEKMQVKTIEFSTESKLQNCIENGNQNIDDNIQQNPVNGESVQENHREYKIDLEEPDIEDEDIELLDIEKLEKQVKKQMKRQMKEILVWRKKIESKQDNIMAVRKARHDKQIENSQKNREVYTAKLEKEKKMLNQIQNNLKKELDQVAKVEEDIIQSEKKALEQEIHKLEANLQEERAVFERTQSEAKKYHLLRENKAASTIQAHFKGFKIRKRYSEEIRIRAKKKLKEIQDQILRLEQEEKRQIEEEKKRKQEEEKLRIEMEIKKKQEEERKKVEMEKRAEQERLKMEEEKRRQEKLRKQREEEEKRLLEEEKKKKEEIERKKRAEEQQRKEEEHRKKLEEKKRIKEQQEKIRREHEERLRKEEEERQRQEQLRRQEQEELRKRQEQEELRKRQEQEELRKRQEQEELRKRQEQEELRRRQEQEELKRHQEQEEIRRRQEQEELKRRQEQQDLKRRQQEEEENRKLLKEEEIRRNQEQDKTLKEEFVKSEITLPSDTLADKVDQGTISQSPSNPTNRQLEKEKSLQLETLIHQGEEEIARKEQQLQQLKQEMLNLKDSTAENIKAPAVTQHRSYDHDDYLQTIHQSNKIISPEWLQNYYQEWLELQMAANKEKRSTIQSATKKKRKPSALSKLVPFPDEQLLAASSSSSVETTCTININGCPTSYSTTSIGRYQSLCWLSLTHCNLKVIDGINQCQKLQYININDNEIEYLDLQGLSALIELNAANNKLTTAHGLDGCITLKMADFSSNKLTRLGEMTNCTALQEIRLDNNRLVTIKGIQNLINLQIISCNSNEITHLDDLDGCHLLHSVSFANNSIQQLPKLFKKPLLTELNLKSNYINSLKEFSSSWLPSLQTLNISENSLSNLEPHMKHFISIQRIDFSDNCLDGFESVIPCVRQLVGLKYLRLNGNAVVEEPNFKAVVTQAMPYIRELNDINLEETTLNSPNDINEYPFVAMIQRQIQMISGLRISYERKLQKLRALQRNDSPKTLIWVKENYYQRMLFGAQQFLQQQLTYCAEVNTDQTEIIDQDFLNLSQSLDSVQYQEHKQAEDLITKTNLSKQVDAAIKIQSLWRGHRTRNAMKQKSFMPPSDMQLTKEEKAAIQIQSLYRGYRIRNRINMALAEAKVVDDDDLDFDGIDLSQFDVKEDYFNDDWIPNDDNFANTNPINTNPVAKNSHALVNHETAPKQVWQLEQSPNHGQFDSSPSSRYDQEKFIDRSHFTSQSNDVPTKAPYDDDQISEVPSSQQYPASKSEEIVDEWGFSNYATAELMKKRARRFKQKKKIVDPQRRYEQFKKQDETSSWKNVKTIKKSDNTNKSNYVQVGKPTAAWELSPPQRLNRKEDYTSAWIQNQSEINSNLSDIDTSPNSHRSKGKGNTHHRYDKLSRQVQSLPQLDAHVIAGKTVRLINPSNENRENDVQHGNNSYRRYSTENVQLPPISRASSSNSGYRSDIINAEILHKHR